MIHPGLLSVTFRKLPPAEIASLAAGCGLGVMEWGGDVHVPPGRPDIAGEVRNITADAGLSTAAYGSYFRVAAGTDDEFAAVLESAVALGAPSVRVWAGTKGSWESDASHMRHVADEALRLADKAAAAGIVLSFEFHGGTVNDTREASLRFLAAAEHPFLATYWQPPLKVPEDESLAGLRDMLPRVRDVHVFQWTVGDGGIVRHPLVEGSTFWSEAFRVLKTSGRDHAAMLEFVRDDSPDAFRADARALLGLIA